VRIGASIAVLVLGLALISGCGPSQNPFVVGIDLYHGQTWPGLPGELESMGFKHVVFDQPPDFDNLQNLGVLIICTKGAETTRGFTEEELDSIVRFVKRGGGLLCADQAWSWVIEAYGNKPLEDFPLNVLGQRLGFRILGTSVGAPRNLSSDMLGGISAVRRSDWWPSEIEFPGGEGRILISDENGRPMAGTVDFGRGRVAVMGNMQILAENPDIVRNLLIYLSGVEDLL